MAAREVTGDRRGPQAGPREDWLASLPPGASSAAASSSSSSASDESLAARLGSATAVARRRHRSASLLNSLAFCIQPLSYGTVSNANSPDRHGPFAAGGPPRPPALAPVGATGRAIELAGREYPPTSFLEMATRPGRGRPIAVNTPTPADGAASRPPARRSHPVLNLRRSAWSRVQIHRASQPSDCLLSTRRRRGPGSQRRGQTGLTGRLQALRAKRRRPDFRTAALVRRGLDAFEQRPHIERFREVAVRAGFGSSGHMLRQDVRRQHDDRSARPGV